jgi:capsular polysaccharide biosynthesis protein
MVSSGNISVAGANSNSTAYGYKLTISVKSDSQEEVIPITNAMASAFAAELNELISSNAIQVMDDATGYASYNTMNVSLYLILFSGAAFVLSCIVIFALAFFSPWVRSVTQCEQDNDLILGLLPYTKNK